MTFVTAHLNPSFFDRYANRGNAIVIAVSGGGDSMALLDLYWRAKIKNDKLPAPTIVSVDHGLRDGFAIEAALVENYCQKFGLPWQLVRWEGEKPATGIMAAARLARYRLLANVALEIGAQTILTGHTLDDQNETMAMRSLRGQARPMEQEVLFARQTWISRPLLLTSRRDLRTHLAHSQIAFADDPTNVDVRYERARIRSKPGTAVFNPESIVLQDDLVQRATRFIALNVKIENKVIVILRPEARDIDAEVFALRYLAATLGGYIYPAPATTGKRLADLFGNGQNGTAFTAQRCRYARITTGIAVTPEARHAARMQTTAEISPFEVFCPLSLLPLANELAQALNQPKFILSH